MVYSFQKYVRLKVKLHPPSAYISTKLRCLLNIQQVLYPKSLTYEWAHYLQWSIVFYPCKWILGCKFTDCLWKLPWTFAQNILMHILYVDIVSLFMAEQLFFNHFFSFNQPQSPSSEIPQEFHIAFPSPRFWFTNILLSSPWYQLWRKARHVLPLHTLFTHQHRSVKLRKPETEFSPHMYFSKAKVWRLNMKFQLLWKNSYLNLEPNFLHGNCWGLNCVPSKDTIKS